MIILLTSNKSKILPTILSRTLKVKFSPLKEDEIISILSLKGFSKNDIKKLLKISDGSVCFIEKLLSNKNLMKYIKDFLSIITMDKPTVEGIITLSQILEKLENEDLNLILEAMDEALHLRVVEGKIPLELYENFLKEKKLLQKAINKGVKKKLALQGFYFDLVS
jgi:DNA polymerase-3 subunit delta'